MVSHRCKLAVRSALDSLGLYYKYVDLGEIDLFEDTLTEEDREKLSSLLLKSGLELMDNKKSILVERIKNTLIELIHYSEELPRNNISEFVSEKLDHDYTYLSNLFKEVTGTTIQHYILLHKIEKAKELILYDELNLNEISYKLHYSSVAHLSNQFKKLTGLTPSYFKKIHSYKKRLMLETI
jgi:AraC-like DNA-binding protein